MHIQIRGPLLPLLHWRTPLEYIILMEVENNKKILASTSSVAYMSAGKSVPFLFVKDTRESKHKNWGCHITTRYTKKYPNTQHLKRKQRVQIWKMVLLQQNSLYPRKYCVHIDIAYTELINAYKVDKLLENCTIWYCSLMIRYRSIWYKTAQYVR